MDSTNTVARSILLYEDDVATLGEGDTILEAARLIDRRDVVGFNLRTGLSSVHVPTGYGDGVEIHGDATTAPVPARGTGPTLGYISASVTGAAKIVSRGGFQTDVAPAISPSGVSREAWIRRTGSIGGQSPLQSLRFAPVAEIDFANINGRSWGASGTIAFLNCKAYLTELDEVFTGEQHSFSFARYDNIGPFLYDQARTFPVGTLLDASRWTCISTGTKLVFASNNTQDYRAAYVEGLLSEI